MADEVRECCGVCDSFQPNVILMFNYDGRCPFDSKAKRVTDRCDEFNIRVPEGVE